MSRRKHKATAKDEIVRLACLYYDVDRGKAPLLDDLDNVRECLLEAVEHYREAKKAKR